MRQKSATTLMSSENLVRDIRRATRKLAELEYERESGKVVLMEVVGDVVVKQFTIVRSRFLSLGAKVALRCTALDLPTEIQAVVDGELREILSDFQRQPGEEQACKR